MTVMDYYNVSLILHICNDNRFFYHIGETFCQIIKEYLNLFIEY